MSAWVVSKAHIDVLVGAALGRDPLVWVDAQGLRQQASTEGADEIGRMLWTECYQSVAWRYPDDKDGELPGPNGLTVEAVRSYRYSHQMTVPGRVGVHEVGPKWIAVTPLLVLKQIDCYQYQSCEHDGWEGSDARRFTDALRQRMVRQLPGYDDGPWGV